MTPDIEAIRQRNEKRKSLYRPGVEPMQHGPWDIPAADIDTLLAENAKMERALDAATTRIQAEVERHDGMRDRMTSDWLRDILMDLMAAHAITYTK